jgi:hypothetical protein
VSLGLRAESCRAPGTIRAIRVVIRGRSQFGCPWPPPLGAFPQIRKTSLTAEGAENAGVLCALGVLWEMRDCLTHAGPDRPRRAEHSLKF